MNLGRLIIRADASVEIGTGHVMRCLALAEAWRDAGGSAIFALANSTPSLLARLSAEQFEYVRIPVDAGSPEDAERTVDLGRSRDADWIVLDGYAFAPAYQWRIKAGGVKLLVIDDNAEAGEFHSDIVLNQNLHACEAMYSKRAPKSQLLLGPRFAMLRREFKKWRGWPREIPPTAHRMLVAMGGSDPQDLSSRVLEALESLDLAGVEIRVATGGSNPRISSLKQLCKEFAGSVKLEVDAAMPDLMAWADLAVAAAGSTCWELCMLGLPAIVIDAAQNQIAVATELSRQKIAFHIPLPQATTHPLAEQIYLLAVNPELRKTMSQKEIGLVDGRGADRVVAAMIENGLSVRRVQAGDCRMLWEWANDPDTRAASFNSERISWIEHRCWFSRKLADQDCILLMIEHEEAGPIATVRFEPHGELASKISLTISPEWRGRGLAAYVLDQAVATAFERPTLERVHAVVKSGNKSSAKAFQRAGFRLEGSTQINGSEALHFILDRSTREASALPAVEEVQCR